MSIAKNLAVLGLPLRSGQPLFGVQFGPKMIRQTGFIPRLEKRGWSVSDLGDMNLHPFNQDRRSIGISEATRRIKNRIVNVYQRGYLPISLGGDHSVAIGTLRALTHQYPNPLVIWVDAHADLNCSASSPSGNYHGKSVAFASNLGKRHHSFKWLDENSGQTSLDPRSVVYLGLRDLDSEEVKRLEEWEVGYYSVEEIDHYGIDHLMESILKNSGNRPIHLSFDIDSVDPRWAPSTGTPVPNGLTPNQVWKIGQSIGKSGQLVSMDVVEVNPQIGSFSDVTKTLKVASRMIEETFQKPFS